MWLGENTDRSTLANTIEGVEGSSYYYDAVDVNIIRDDTDKIINFSKGTKIKFGDEFEIDAEDLGKILKKFTELHMPQVLV